MNPHLIPALLAALASVPSAANVSNPYAGAAQRCNLHAYLDALCRYPYSGHLYIGEAPGRKGCALTGIPFSSERVLRSGVHPFLPTLFPSLTLMANSNVAERSATIVWTQFAGKSSLPAFWNAFPFHPHDGNAARTNRPPTSAEIAAGIVFVQAVAQILNPHTIVTVGGAAASVVGRAFSAPAFAHLSYLSLPHPSYQGTAGFIAGCASLNIQ